MTWERPTHFTFVRGEVSPKDLRDALDGLGVKQGQAFQIAPMNGELPHGTRFNHSDEVLTMDFRNNQPPKEDG